MSFTRLSPAQRLGYEPCPKCGGRKAKSAIATALSGGLKCDHPFHLPGERCGRCGTPTPGGVHGINGCFYGRPSR